MSYRVEGNDVIIIGSNGEEYNIRLSWLRGVEEIRESTCWKTGYSCVKLVYNKGHFTLDDIPMSYVEVKEILEQLI